MLEDLLFDSSSEDKLLDQDLRRRKVYKPRINFDLDETNERFRMSLGKLELLTQEIGPVLQHQYRKGGALTPKQQICIALHWMGSGAQYHTVADMHGVSKSSACKCVRTVGTAVNNHLFNSVIKWPENIAADVNKFFRISKFLHVIGVVDGSLIPIDVPVVNEAAFVDKHGNHSINCMFVCGPTCQFYYVSARWPGSVHDSQVLRNSNLHNRMDAENIFPNGVILGDSGLLLKTWLMTPLHNDPYNVAETRYNPRLKATRQIVECALGLLKEKFPCLNKLRLNPVYAGEVVKCCSILCNFARKGEDNDVQINENHHEQADVIDYYGQADMMLYLQQD